MKTIEQKQKPFDPKYSKNPSERDEAKGHYNPNVFEAKFDNRGKLKSDTAHLFSHLEDAYEGVSDVNAQPQIVTREEEKQKLLEKQGNEILLEAGDGELVWTSDDSGLSNYDLSDSDEESPVRDLPVLSPEEVGVKGGRRIRDELARLATVEDLPLEEADDLGDPSLPDRYITRNPG